MMKYIIIIMLVILPATVLTAGNGQNTPVSGSSNLSCTVIKPISISPESSFDYLNWPTIPAGSKYYFGSHLYEDSDVRSIFTISGEPGYDVLLSLQTQTEVDDTELSFTLKGTSQQYLGGSPVPELTLNNNGQAVVNLNSGGAFYVHINSCT
ncbi:MAG: hypothetical protein ACOCZW_01565 [Bacteroidota bacterium]